MRRTPALMAIPMLLGVVLGCASEKPYGVETQLSYPGPVRQVWAVAPVINLSGQPLVDPILQADLLYQQLQQVHGLTIIPVDRVAAVLTAMRLEQIQSAEQAEKVCQSLGCDALVVATITAYDPYNPPKVGASLALFPAHQASTRQVDPRELSRSASGQGDAAMPDDGGFVQVVGLYDAANGSTRDALMAYAAGRNDPKGPLADKEYMVSMDRYVGFVHHELIRGLLESPRLPRP